MIKGQTTKIYPLQRVMRSGTVNQLDLFDRTEAETGGLFAQALERDLHGHSLWAASTYREAIEAGDRAADCFCNLAVIHYERGQEGLAKDRLEDALINEPAHGMTHYNLGTLALHNGNPRLAIVHFGEAILRIGEFPYADFNLAVAHTHEGNKKDALAALERFSRKLPQRSEFIRDFFEVLYAAAPVSSTANDSELVQIEVEHLIKALEKRKMRVPRKSGAMRPKEFRDLAMAIESLERLVS